MNDDTTKTKERILSYITLKQAKMDNNFDWINKKTNEAFTTCHILIKICYNTKWRNAFFLTLFYTCASKHEYICFFSLFILFSKCFFIIIIPCLCLHTKCWWKKVAVHCCQLNIFKFYYLFEKKNGTRKSKNYYWNKNLCLALFRLTNVGKIYFCISF